MVMRDKSSTDLTRGGMLDVLRFLAAAFIVVFHFGQEAPVALVSVNEFFGRGYLATDFFLLLSGFILARVHGGRVMSGRITTAQFLIRRLLRIYPAHLITLAVTVAVVLGAELIGLDIVYPERFAWSALPAHLLLVHGWGFTPLTWNFPTWSLSALAVCYASFPWVWRQLRAVDQPVACLGVILVVVVGAEMVAYVLMGQSGFSLPGVEGGLLRAVPLFVAGLALARLVEISRPATGLANAIAACGAVVFVLSAVLHGPDIVDVLATMATVYGLGAGGIRRAWPAAAWAAQISFSLFITHIPASLIYFRGLSPMLTSLYPGVAAQWTIWAGASLFALAVAAAFHHRVDQPIQRWLRAARFNSGPATASASASAGNV